jgi:hypothetical protein
MRTEHAGDFRRWVQSEVACDKGAPDGCASGASF